MTSTDFEKPAREQEAGVLATGVKDNSTAGEEKAQEQERNGSSSSNASGHNAALEKAASESAEPPSETNKPRRSKMKTTILMFSLGLAVFMAALDQTIITTALPSICEYFHSTIGYTWIGSSFLLGSAATVPLWGKISDIFGRKPTLLVANVVFFVGSALCATATSMSMLLAGRSIQGGGGGGLVVLVNICIGDLFSMRERGAYYGIIGGVWALASAVGPLIGGAFATEVSWRWCFYINLPLDGIAFVILIFFLDLQTPKTPLWAGLRAIDWPGTLTVMGGTLMLLFGLTFGGETFPWESATVICLLVFGAVTIGLFVIVEARFATYPIIPGRLFAQRRTALAALGVCTSHGITFISGSYFLPLYFQASRGASPIASGVDLLPFVLSLSVMSGVVGIIIKKTGAYVPVIIAGMSFMTLGFGLFIDLDAGSSWAKLACYQIVAGVGVGPNFQAPLIALQAHVPPKDIASATATFAFVRQLATATSIVLGNVVFQNRMAAQAATLTAALGPRLAAQLSGSSAGANVGLIGALSERQRAVVQDAYSDSLSTMWIMYVAFAFAGLLASGFIEGKKLNKSHEETRTGLEAEKERAVVRGKKSEDVEAPPHMKGALEK